MYKKQYGGYYRRKKRNIPKIVLIITISITIAMLILAYLTLQEHIVFTSDGVRFDLEQTQTPPIITEDIPLEIDGVLQNPETQNPETQNPASKPQSKPQQDSDIFENANTSISFDKAFYLSNLSEIDSTIAKFKAGEIASVILDLKNEGGNLSYNTNIEYMINTQKSQPLLETVLDRLKLEKIPLTAKINAYHDPVATKINPPSAIKTTGGLVWLNQNSKAHLNPDDSWANVYLNDLILEAKSLGFSSVLLSNFSFPALGKQNLIDYTNLSATKVEILERNLEEIAKTAKNNSLSLSLQAPNNLTDGKNINSGFDSKVFEKYVYIYEEK